jgi:hypothetical protein
MMLKHFDLNLFSRVLWLTLMQIVCMASIKMEKYDKFKLKFAEKMKSSIIPKSNLSYFYHIGITRLPLLWHPENPLCSPTLKLFTCMHTSWYIYGDDGGGESDVSSINMLLMRKVDKLRGSQVQKVKSRSRHWREWMNTGITQFITLNWWMFLWYFKYTVERLI